MVDSTQNVANVANNDGNARSKNTQQGVNTQPVVDSFQQIPADPGNQPSPTQGGAFGGVPFGQAGSNGASDLDFDISADDIPDFSENTNQTVNNNPQDSNKTTAVDDVSQDISLDVLDQSNNQSASSATSSGFDPNTRSTSSEKQTEPAGVSDQNIDLSGLGNMGSGSADVDKQMDAEKKDETTEKAPEKPTNNSVTQEPTVYDEGLAQEERDIQKDEPKKDRSKMVSKFYELTGLVNQGLDISEDKTFSVLGHQTDKERVEYRFVPVKNVDAGFKIEKIVDQDKDGELDVLTMTYKESFSSLRLYMNGEMLYQEVKGDDKGDENRTVILDKLNKFTLLVGEYIKKFVEAQKEQEKKKELANKLKDF